MNMHEALKQLGVTDELLTREEKQKLDDNGFVVFENLIDPVWLDELKYLFELNIRKEGVAAGKDFSQEKGARRLADLVNKGVAYDKVYTYAKVLAAVHHVINRPFKLSSLNGRDAIAGEGNQALHADWGRREANEPFNVCNSIWLLDDFTLENGATRIVPGSHKMGGSITDYVKNPEASHPDQLVLTAPAGTVAVFNSHMWHGGTKNITKDKTRRAIHCYFTSREHGQQTNQAETMRQVTFNRITPAARYILDVE